MKTINVYISFELNTYYIKKKQVETTIKLGIIRSTTII